jgi:uroporphyrinogen-III synthase
MRLLVTRPEGDGERTAEALRGRGHEVLLAPMLRMRAVDFALADEHYQAVVMTSANAARSLAGHRHGERLASLPAFTVGRHTADAARALGFRDVQSADGDQRDLVALIRSRPPHPGAPPLLYLAGEERAGDLAGDLAASGIRVHTVVAYRAVKAERFPLEIEAALAQRALDGVLHFSRRSAEAYVACATHTPPALELLHFCLSRAVSEPLVAAGAAGIRIAARPDEAALLALVGDR